MAPRIETILKDEAAKVAALEVEGKMTLPFQSTDIWSPSITVTDCPVPCQHILVLANWSDKLFGYAQSGKADPRVFAQAFNIFQSLRVQFRLSNEIVDWTALMNAGGSSVIKDKEIETRLALLDLLKFRVPHLIRHMNSVMDRLGAGADVTMAHLTTKLNKTEIDAFLRMIYSHSTTKIKFEQMLQDCPSVTIGQV